MKEEEQDKTTRAARAEELLELSKKRARQHPSVADSSSGGELIGIGVTLIVLGGIFWFATFATDLLGAAFPTIIAGVVASLAGSLFILAGIIRWAIQPILHYLERIDRQMRETERPEKSDDPDS